MTDGMISAGRSPGRARTMALYAIVLLTAIVVAGATVAYADRVPERVASHWSGALADGWMSLTALTYLNGALVLVLGFGILKLALSMPMGRGVRPAAGIAVAAATLVAGLHVVTLQASRGAPELAAIPFPTRGFLTALALAVVVGVLGWAISPDGAQQQPGTLEATRLETVPGEAVVWTGSASASGWLIAVPAAIAGGGVVLMMVGEVLAGLVLVLASVLVSTVARVGVTIGPAGLRVRVGPLGLVRTVVPLAAITAVHAEQVEPMAYGGWGLRMVHGTRAVVIRRGEGLRLERVGKADLVVTVDDARRGAGVLLAHLATRSDAPR